MANKIGMPCMYSATACITSCMIYMLISKVYVHINDFNQKIPHLYLAPICMHSFTIKRYKRVSGITKMNMIGVQITSQTPAGSPL